MISNEELVHLTGTAFAQLAVVEALAEQADVPGVIAKMTDPSTRPNLTDEDANLIGVFASCSMLALSKVTELIASYSGADYKEYYDQWIAAEVERIKG